MSREVKRVPDGFVWPLYEEWHGHLRPARFDGIPCWPCASSGYSPQARMLEDLWYGYLPFDPATTGSRPYTPETPAVRAFAERNIAHAPEYYHTGEYATYVEALRLANLFNSQWCHHLAQEDVDALLEADRLWDFTRVWTREHRWQRTLGGGPVTAAEVNIWSLSGLGHDSLNCGIVVRARCERNGIPDLCEFCAGEGSTEAYPGQRDAADAWQPTPPPAGDAWQLWETTSHGSPISPVFDSAEQLAGWISNPDRDDRYQRDWMPYPVAHQFVLAGWAPTGVNDVSGMEFVGMLDQGE